MRIILITLAYIFCFNVQLKAQDFRVNNFHENLTDLSAAMSGVKDRNDKEAALIRFAVRDNKFELEPNLGILKKEVITGEIRLYVPEDTKRITIRHPLLGVLRDYTLPVAIKSKTTYDAEIVITNNEYLQALVGKGVVEIPSILEEKNAEQSIEEHLEEEQEELLVEEPIVEKPIVDVPSFEEPNEEKPMVEVPIVEDTVITKETMAPLKVEEIKLKNDSIQKKFGVYAGLGFNAVSAMGPSLHLGIRYKSFYLEAGYVIGLDQVKDINFTIKGQSTSSESYDYSASKFWLRLGYATGKRSNFQVDPQIGVSFNMINGKTKGTSSTAYFKQSNPMSFFAALRFSYKITKGLRIHLTPQYDFAPSGDEVFTVIKSVDSKIKSWGEGFGMNAGLLYYF